MAAHLVQGTLAAAVPCADDSPGLVVVCVVDGSNDSTAWAACDRTVPQGAECPFCRGGCQLTQIPALAVAFVPPSDPRPHVLEKPAPEIDNFSFHFDRILRPPK